MTIKLVAFDVNGTLFRDQNGDIRFSLEAGCVPVAYTGGVHGSERFKKAGAKIFIENLEYMLEILKKFAL